MIGVRGIGSDQMLTTSAGFCDGSGPLRRRRLRMSRSMLGHDHLIVHGPAL
jgi:hypothetical protein